MITPYWLGHPVKVREYILVQRVLDGYPETGAGQHGEAGGRVDEEGGLQPGQGARSEGGGGAEIKVGGDLCDLIMQLILNELAL